MEGAPGAGRGNPKPERVEPVRRHAHAVVQPLPGTTSLMLNCTSPGSSAPTSCRPPPYRHLYLGRPNPDAAVARRRVVIGDPLATIVEEHRLDPSAGVSRAFRADSRQPPSPPKKPVLAVCAGAAAGGQNHRNCAAGENVAWFRHDCLLRIRAKRSSSTHQLRVRGRAVRFVAGTTATNCDGPLVRRRGARASPKKIRTLSRG